MKKKFPSSIYFVILCINICSIIVLSIFNYYVFHSNSNKAYLESFLSYQQRVTDLAFNNIDTQILQPLLKISQIHFSPIKENEPLLVAQETDISSSSQKVRALSTEMKKMQKTYPYITNFDIYYEGTGIVVTSFDKVHFPSGDDRLYTYLPWYEDFQSGKLKEGFQYNPEGFYLEGSPTITYIKKVSMMKWGEKNIILAMSIDPQIFNQYLDQREGDFVIMDLEDQVIYDSSHLEVSTGKEKDVEVLKQQSAVTGLTYLYKVDSSLFYKDYKITSRMFLLNFLISIVFNIIVLLVISYYSYAAYRRRVLTLSEKAGIAIDESDRSFDGSLHVLTKEFSQLHAAVQSSRGMMFQSAVRAVILGRTMEQGDELIAPYLNGNYTCAYIIFLAEKYMENLMIEEIQDEYLPNHKDYDVMYTTVERDSLVAILVFNEGKRESVHNDFMVTVNSHWKNCQIVSGRVCPVSEDGIKMSYLSAREAERYRFIITEGTHLSANQIHLENRKETGSHLKLFEAMKKDINNEDLLQLKTHLEMMVTSFKSGHYTIEYCNSTLRDFVSFLYQVMQQYQLDMWIVFGYDIREYYKKLANIDAFYNWCGNLCETLLKNIHQKKQIVDVDIREEMLKLIDENLENNISLDYLAEKFNMRTDAASRAFRQMMGVGYVDYIKTRKLERGIELMAEGYSVKDIAEKLGYSTSQYFIKVFKESYGLTPLQYKKKMEMEKEKE